MLTYFFSKCYLVYELLGVTQHFLTSVCQLPRLLKSRAKTFEFPALLFKKKEKKRIQCKLLFAIFKVVCIVAIVVVHRYTYTTLTNTNVLLLSPSKTHCIFQTDRVEFTTP